MPNPIMRIHNTETNEVIDREMTDAEFDNYQTLKTIDEAEIIATKTKATAKTALLTKLGITADEAALLA
jgi:hypothetical protein